MQFRALLIVIVKFVSRIFEGEIGKFIGVEKILLISMILREFLWDRKTFVGALMPDEWKKIE